MAVGGVGHSIGCQEMEGSLLEAADIQWGARTDNNHVHVQFVFVMDFEHGATSWFVMGIIDAFSINTDVSI